MTASTRRQTGLERWTIRLAPAVGITAVVACALLMTDSEVRWVRVYTGPTDQTGPQSWRLSVMQGTSARSIGVAMRGTLSVWSFHEEPSLVPFETDSEGRAWVNVPLPKVAGPRVNVRVSDGKNEIATGSIAVSRKRWLSSERVEGGWCSGMHEGPVDIRLGVAEGVLLHGFPSQLVVALSLHGQPFAQQPLQIEMEGARLGAGGGQSRVMLVTDAHGTARLSVVPADLAASVNITVREPEPSRLHAALPVRAGGMRAWRADNELRIGAMPGTAVAWVALLTEHGLVDVQSVPLKSQGDWATASVAVHHWPDEQWWAIVSSELELDAPNTIGWPLSASPHTGEVQGARVVPNVLALDSSQVSFSRLARQRHRALMASTSILLAMAMALVWVISRSNRRQQLAIRQLGRELPVAERLAERLPWAAVATGVVLMAVAALVIWAAAGMR